MDYGHELEFGYFLVPEASDPQRGLEVARLVDRLGYDLIGIQDHPYQPRFFDTLALIGWILARTDSVRVFADVHDLPLRPPAVLAKAAATLDVLSGGRFDLGIGSGGFLDAAHSMGAPARTPGESLAALEEAIAIIRAMWTSQGRRLRFDGAHYQLAGVSPGPAPAHAVQIWIGANKPRALALTGKLADGWVAPLMNWKPPAQAAQANEVIDRAAREAGRDPREIRRIYNVTGVITRSAQGPATDDDQAIIGPSERWIDVSTHLALDIGFSTFVLATDPEPTMLTTFMEEVAPEVRRRVAAAPGRSHSSALES